MQTSEFVQQLVLKQKKKREVLTALTILVQAYVHSHPWRATVPQSYFSIDAEQTPVNTEQCRKDKHPYIASYKKQWNQTWRK